MHRVPEAECLLGAGLECVGMYTAKQCCINVLDSEDIWIACRLTMFGRLDKANIYCMLVSHIPPASFIPFRSGVYHYVIIAHAHTVSDLVPKDVLPVELHGLL